MSTAGFHITEDCAEVYLQNESGMEFLQLARRLHDYLQQGQRLPARSFFEATDGCKEISREAFDTLAKRRMENTGEISGLFELDFDARTFSALNIMDGWKVYAMQNVADAAAQAYQEALKVVTPLALMSREDQLYGIASALRAVVDDGSMAYSMEANHYNDPYGYFVLRTASCAGCARATALCLDILGIPYEHVNENQYSHQWCRVPMEDGSYWICDAFGLYCGPEPEPYQHPYF